MPQFFTGSTLILALCALCTSAEAHTKLTLYPATVSLATPTEPPMLSLQWRKAKKNRTTGIILTSIGLTGSAAATLFFISGATGNSVMGGAALIGLGLITIGCSIPFIIPGAILWGLGNKRLRALSPRTAARIPLPGYHYHRTTGTHRMSLTWTW